MNWDAHKEDKEKRRFVEKGLGERPPVLAVPGFFLAMWLSGWASSALLLKLGMISIPARYAISTVVSYGVFIGAVGIWCRQATAPRKSDSNLGSPIDGIGGLSGSGGDGCLVGIAVLAVIGLISGAFWLVGGYAMLFEVAFEVAFAGTMVYRLNQRHVLGDWAGMLVRRTWLPALILSGLLVGIGAKMQHDHPEAKTLSQVIKAQRSTPK